MKKAKIKKKRKKNLKITQKNQKIHKNQTLQANHKRKKKSIFKKMKKKTIVMMTQIKMKRVNSQINKGNKNILQ